jgi:hypothetical protein
MKAKELGQKKKGHGGQFGKGCRVLPEIIDERMKTGQ